LPRHPDAVAAVRVCGPSPRTGNDEIGLVVSVASDKLHIDAYKIFTGKYDTTVTSWLTSKQASII